MNFYKIVCIITALLFSFLFINLMFFSDGFVRDMGLQPSETITILARRTAIFMLGIVVLMLSSMNLPHSRARTKICLALVFTMFGLACMGTMELIRGTVNSSMYQAIAIESVIGAAFLYIILKNRKAV